MAGLPDFLIIGAQKCGTSWLHRKLRLHPEIFLPAAKDQGFFCWQQGPHASSLQQYQQSFAAAADGQLTGEATAAYFWTESGSKWDKKPPGYSKDLPKRVVDTLGTDTRLILSLRNPVERAVSAYLHHIANGDLEPAISLLDAGDFSGLIDIGFYAAHLHNWLRYFPLDQFQILIFEQDVMQHQQHTLKQLFRFLKVNPDWQVPEPEQVVFEGRKRSWQEDGVWVPQGSLPAAPGSEQRQIDGQTFSLMVDRATLNSLQDIYAQDRQQLQNLLGIDLGRVWS